jgi:hypothetical protein
MSVSTAHLLADKALQETAGQQCVDWAIGMLEQGYESEHLIRLAGMLPLYNHFEVSSLRDRALEELQIRQSNNDSILRQYAAELLSEGLNGGRELNLAIKEVKDLYIRNGFDPGDLKDFYLLYFAYTDLQDSDMQWYWPSGTRENINAIIRERAAEFVAAQQSQSGNTERMD